MKILACTGMWESEQGVLDGFRSAGLEVDEILVENFSEEIMKREEYLFVLTVNYSPGVSKKCQNLLVPYFSYVTEWPLRELYDLSVKNPCNYIFCFDREVYRWLHRLLPDRSYHLPLGTDMSRWNGFDFGTKEKAVDVSYVGKLYQNAESYDVIEGISDYVRGYMEALLRVQMRIHGCNLLELALSTDVVEELKRCMPYEKLPEESLGTDQNVLANIYLADKVADMERALYLETVAKKFDTHIYITDNGYNVPKACVHGQLQTSEERAAVYQNSRINLHITHRAIISGVPQEIYDIMVAGGFVLTNFQPEIPELFVIGEHLETYSSEQELVEKIAYYLEHEDERAKIAKAGQQMVRDYHSYLNRAVTIFNTVFSNQNGGKDGSI